MKKNKSLNQRLIAAVLTLVMLTSSLIGTTFAWFTDSVTSDSNIIKSGNLDVEMYWAEGKEDPASVAWNDASKDAIFNNDKWEPGYAEVRHIKIENKGTLSLAYKISIVANGEVTDLADVIDVYYLDPAAQITDRNQLTDSNKLGTLTEVLANLASTGTGSLAKGESDTVTLALKMRDDAGNDYQDKSIGSTFSVQLLATQAVGEFDSFGDDYDNNAAADFFPGFQGGSAGIAVTTDDQGVTVGESAINAGDVSAVIPEGVKLADGANSLQLAVTLKNSSDANIQLSEAEKLGTLDVHIEGVAEGNTTPMLVTLKGYLTTGINTGALRLYHVENGATVAMTQVATPVNHNEFSYDPATGDVTLALASFSEVAVVADTNNPWDGETLNYLWYDASATELTIYNADQLAGFAAIVDGKAEGIARDSFYGKTVKLGNNIYLSGKLFEPIGWGYVNASHNRDVDGDGKGDPGKVFQGIFDGNGKTIYDLYQNGWDLEEKTGTVYTYTNCGFGLFAAASNAIFKNLTINGADVKVECVEAGVLVGLSQNNCIYQNINIYNAKIANYQRPAGGLIGEVSGEGTTTITNVTIGSDVVVGSLWGDFDAPCGGVIGAYWNDVDADPKIEMTDVEVGARMDVYSDVTSAYQWYAYRRAGMLIGNTDYSEKNESGTNIASTKINGTNYLTCSNVKVYYGDWANYHYAQFTNQDNDWCNNYPWVRVEAGENCSAYSNPRYGVPVVNGVKVSDMDATTLKNTQTGYVERRFNQLYGGGQGVYGQFEHEGVEFINYRYSITYVNDYQVLAIKYVTESGAVNTANDVAQQLVCDWADVNIGKNKYNFGGWMNAGSTKLTEIPADNTKNIVLYPWFNDPYTARFVDQNGNVVAYCFFHDGDGGLDKLDETRILAESALPDLGEDLEFDHWKVQITNNEGKVTSEEDFVINNFAGYKQDVTIYPVYLFKGDVNLIPVDSDADGIINYYQVAGYSNPNGQAMVEIPASVNGKPILQINEKAFSGYDGVHSIVVPNGVIIQKNAFTSGSKFGSGEEITIYFEGTKAQWNALNKETGWNYGIGTGSRVFFLKDGKVNTAEGYLEVVDNGWFLDHDYQWSEKTDFASVKNTYTGTCNCSNTTTGDTAHVYKDANGNVMNHNDEGTPIGNNGNVITFKAGSWGREDKLTDGTTDTYKRYRPDTAYWEGV